jgi:branched-subunit amino acid transport protein
VTAVEPERELVRRVLPFVPVAILGAFAIGWVVAGSGAAWSAGIAIAVVAGNLVAFALSIAWASKVSPTMLAIVALGGYLVRLIIFTMVLVGLNTLAWFSPLAFLLALMPATIALLVYEAKLLSGRLQADLWSFEEARP